MVIVLVGGFSSISFFLTSPACLQALPYHSPLIALFVGNGWGLIGECMQGSCGVFVVFLDEIGI